MNSPSPRDIAKLRTRRMEALRRHIIALGMIIDEAEPGDIVIHKPGDVVQILPGYAHAGSLMRVTDVLERDQLRGYLLAVSYRFRAGMRLPDTSAAHVRKIGHAPDAIELRSYPLQEQPPLSFEQSAEAARIGFLEADRAIRERRAAAARNRRAAAKALKPLGPERAGFSADELKKRA